MKYQPLGVSPVVRKVWMTHTTGRLAPRTFWFNTCSPRLTNCTANMLEDRG